MRNEGTVLLGRLLAGIAFVAVLLLALWGYGAWKAAAYERVTGRSVDAWDALILDLKIHQ